MEVPLTIYLAFIHTNYNIVLMTHIIITLYILFPESVEVQEYK